MKTIGIIVKKELSRYFTDKRMILSLILPGLLIFVLYSLMGNFMGNAVKTPTQYNICIVNSPEEFSSFQTVEGWTITLVDNSDMTREDILNQIREQTLDLYIEYDENFYQNVINYQQGTTKFPEVKMYYNTASDASSSIYNYYLNALDAFESNLSNRFNINSSVDEIYDLAKNEDITIRIFTMMLPFLLVILLFSGCMGICSEAIAGEKERGTIATLLVTPAKRGELAIGKLISLSVTSLFSAAASFIGLVCSLPKLMMGSGEVSLSVYGFSTYALLFIVILSTVLVFSVVLTMISTLAKSVKEANGYSMPVMMIVMLLGITSFMGTGASTNVGLYFIPVYNSIQCFTAILSTEIQPMYFAVAIISNLVFVGLGVYLLTKMFNNEKIMFNK